MQPSWTIYYLWLAPFIPQRYQPLHGNSTLRPSPPPVAVARPAPRTRVCIRSHVRRPSWTSHQYAPPLCCQEVVKPHLAISRNVGFIKGNVNHKLFTISVIRYQKLTHASILQNLYCYGQIRFITAGKTALSKSFIDMFK